MLICILIPITYCCNGKFYTGWLYKKLFSGMFFSDIITILFETYIEFLIAGYMNLKHPLFTPRGEAYGLALGIVGLVLCLLVLPILSICFIKLSKEKIEELEDVDPKFSDSKKVFCKEFWMTFYYGDTKYNTKLERAYKLVFILRRIAFLSIAFFVKGQINQIILMHFLQLAIIIYHASARPFVKRYIVNLNLINEFLVYVAIIIMGLFTDYVPNQDTKYGCGWFMSSIVAIMIFINMIPVLIINLQNSRLVCNKCYIKCSPRCRKCCKEYFQNPDPEE